MGKGDQQHEDCKRKKKLKKERRATMDASQLNLLEKERKMRVQLREQSLQKMKEDAKKKW